MGLPEKREEVELKLAADSLQVYVSRLSKATSNHYDAAREFEFLDFVLSWASVALAAIVGVTAIKDLHLLPLWLFVLLSLVSAALGALAKGSGFAERAAHHKEAGQRFGSALRFAEDLVVSEADARTFDNEKREELQAKFDEADKAAPSLPSHIYYTSRPARRRRAIAMVVFIVAIIVALGFALRGGARTGALGGGERSQVETPAVK